MSDKQAFAETERLRIGDAAKFLGVSKKSIARWVQAGLVRGWRVGNILQVAKEDLLAQVREVAPAVRKKREPRNTEVEAWEERKLKELLG